MWTLCIEMVDSFQIDSISCCIFHPFSETSLWNFHISLCNFLSKIYLTLFLSIVDDSLISFNACNSWSEMFTEQLLGLICRRYCIITIPINGKIPILNMTIYKLKLFSPSNALNLFCDAFHNKRNANFKGIHISNSI